MPRFRIEEKALNRITLYVVFIFNHSIGDWVFQSAFYTEKRAIDFISKLKNKIRKGDFSCLTLRN